MKNSLSPLLVLLILGASSAASARPTRGTNELRLTQPFVAGVTVSGFNRLTVEDESLTLFGAAAGWGRFVTEHVALGATVSLLSFSVDDESIWGPGLSPFARFYTVVNQVGLFAELSAQYQMLMNEGETLHLYGPGIDLGVELFIVDSWAIRLSPTFRYLAAEVSGDANGGGGDEEAQDALKVFGFNWGISAYF